MTPELQAYHKKWYAENREKVLAQKKVYREARRESINANLRAYYRKNSERLRRNAKAYAATHKLERRDRELRKAYGLSLDGYNRISAAQQHLCAICLEKKSLHVDHDHRTSRVRGLLCSNCNNGLGRFKDNTGYLSAAIMYLKGNWPYEISNFRS